MDQQAKRTVIQLYSAVPTLSLDDVASPEAFEMLFNLPHDCGPLAVGSNQNETPSVCMADIVDLKTKRYSK